MPVLVIGKKLFTCRWSETLDGTPGFDIIITGTEQLPASTVLEQKARKLLNHTASLPKTGLSSLFKPFAGVLREAQIKDHRRGSHTLSGSPCSDRNQHFASDGVEAGPQPHAASAAPPPAAGECPLPHPSTRAPGRGRAGAWGRDRAHSCAAASPKASEGERAPETQSAMPEPLHSLTRPP